MKQFISTIFLLFLLANSLDLRGQTIRVEGIVSDRQTKQRIANVKIANLRTGNVIFNKTRGDFVLNAVIGDRITASSLGYFSDTLVVDKNGLLLFKLLRESIYIDEVKITGRKTPEEILKKAQEDYQKAYRLADYGSVFSTGSNGAGVSINSIYSLFSKEAKRARKLTKKIESDYRENVIDYKFSKELISKTTGLNFVEAENFRRAFRPTYFFVVAASDYEMINYIRECFVKYSKNPGQYFIEPFPTNNYKLAP